MEVLLQGLSPLKAWLQAQTAEGMCQAFDTTLLCPLVLSPPRCFGWASTANLSLSRLNKIHQLVHSPALGTILSTAEDQVEGSGALTYYCCHQTSVHETTPSESSTLHLRGVKYTVSAYPNKLEDSILSDCCLYSCNKVRLYAHIPHVLPIPKSHLLHLPFTCFRTNAFSAFPLTP